MNSQNCLFSELYETQKYSQWKNVKILIFNEVWCDFDRASSLICGNKMPTRCNRDFYYRYYCLLNMFRAPLCPSSGAQEYYTVVAACSILCCGFQGAGLVWSWVLCVRFAECLLVTVNQWLKHYSTKRLVACLIPTVVNGIFQWNNDSFGTMALGSTYPQTEMSTRCVSWG